MNASDAREIERHRRWLRPDWKRWIRPDWVRLIPPARREAMSNDFALRERAFDTLPARRSREEREARERELNRILKHEARVRLSAQRLN